MGFKNLKAVSKVWKVIEPANNLLQQYILKFFILLRISKFIHEESALVLECNESTARTYKFVS
jgi:hypothetical protein